MVDSAIIKVIQNVIDEFVIDEKMFTAHDVTLEVRNRGHKISHRDCRDVVHDIHQRGAMDAAYTRTIITVPTGQPYLYHRLVDDPTDYDNVRGSSSPQPFQNSVGQQSTISIPIDSSDNDDDDDDDDAVSATSFKDSKKKLTREVDARKSLTIPADFIRDLGLKPHDKVYAGKVLDRIVIKPTNFSGSTKYTVDGSNNVRLTQPFLTKNGLPGNNYTVVNENQELFVESA